MSLLPADNPYALAIGAAFLIFLAGSGFWLRYQLTRRKVDRDTAEEPVDLLGKIQQLVAEQLESMEKDVKRARADAGIAREAMVVLQERVTVLQERIVVLQERMEAGDERVRVLQRLSAAADGHIQRLETVMRDAGMVVPPRPNEIAVPGAWFLNGDASG